MEEEDLKGSEKKQNIFIYSFTFNVFNQVFTKLQKPETKHMRSVCMFEEYLAGRWIQHLTPLFVVYICIILLITV